MIAKKTIFKIKPYVPGKPMSEVKRELGLKSVIKLASNENPYGPSPLVLRVIQKEAKELNRYPDGDCFSLRQELARFLKVRPRQLIFGNGSDEIIVMAARAFLRPQDEVIVAQPSFLIYAIASALEGAVIKTVPLKDFRYDLEGMRQRVTPRTKIIFLGNPDNPAGTYLSQKQLENFLSALPSRVLVFLDEAYFEFVHAADYGNSIGLLKKYKNVLLTRTFSKMYALAGLRIGYGISSEKVVDCLNRVREPFNVNSLAQAAAVACLNDQDYYRRIARLLEAEREFLYQSFEQCKLDYVKSFTNFILINVRQKAKIIAQKLLRKGIIVRDMSGWGLKQYIRVTIGKREENKKFIQALKEIL